MIDDNIKRNDIAQRTTNEIQNILNEKTESSLTQIPITSHLLNNFNLIKFNNYVFPRLVIKDDATKIEPGSLIEDDEFENQLSSFQKYLEDNNIALSNILPHLFNDINMYKMFSSSNNFLNNINTYSLILCNHNLFVYYAKNKQNFIKIQNAKKIVIDNNISTEFTVEKDDNEKQEEKQENKILIRRGRKTNKKKNKIHTSLCVDNITRKIQVNYLSFVIYFANDIVRTVLPPERANCLRFKHIEYTIKRSINLMSLNEIRSKTMGEILQMKETNKSTAKSLSNKEKYLALYSLHNEIINSFFNKSYVYIFENYYLKLNNIRFFEGIKLKLSLKTKKNTYAYLENDIGLSNEKVNIIIRKYFIHGHRKYKNKFYIRKEN